VVAFAVLASSVLAKRLAGKNVSKVTYFISDGTKNLNSASDTLCRICNLIMLCLYIYKFISHTSADKIQ